MKTLTKDFYGIDRVGCPGGLLRERCACCSPADSDIDDLVALVVRIHRGEDLDGEDLDLIEEAVEWFDFQNADAADHEW